jgi:uncharacterized membrane protein HdeD (DUF308 family)
MRQAIAPRSKDSPSTTGRSAWWVITLIGLTITVLGVIASADLVLATVASIFAVGVMMIIAALLQLAHAPYVPGWRNGLLWVVSGLLYLFAGILALFDPTFAATMLTLLLAASLAVSGIFRCWLAWNWTIARPGSFRSWLARREPVPDKLWLTMSGLVSLGAGLLVARGWPVDSMWVLGLVLAVDLLVQGILLMLVGLALRR